MYPLSNIDQLVDNMIGYELNKFLYSYSGYNLIRMLLSNEENMTFMINGPSQKIILNIS